MSEKKDILIENVPAARELRRVKNFDPLRFLKKSVSRTGEKVLKLELPYKKLWFRLACPNGRMLLTPLRITDQMAIFEAKIYSGKDDPSPIASFTSTQMARNVPGGLYIRAAQDEALNEALDNAGFGIQLCDVIQVSNGGGRGSEIPLAQVAAVQKTDPVAEASKKDIAAGAEASTVPAQVVKEPPTDAETAKPPAPATAVPEQATPPAPLTEVASAQAAEDDPPEDAEATPVEVIETPQSTYTEDMTVEEICERMTLDEAREIQVPVGTCKGWTLGQVAANRAASLQWYVLEYSKVSNIVKAGATLLLNDLGMKKAG